MKWSIVSAVNNETVTKQSLLASPGLRAASEVVLQRGFTSAADAYNAGLAKVTTDLAIFLHQDVYLPDTWPADLSSALEKVAAQDPAWGVLGVWGPRLDGVRAGYVYDGGWGKVLGNEFSGGQEVQTLDEVLLIFRKSSGLRFDPRIPGFHMYGADLCTQARTSGRKCFAISAFCIHNTNQYTFLPWAFWKAYLAMRKKWRGVLPIKTSCTEITTGCWPMVQWNMSRAFNLLFKRDKAPAKRVSDPSRVYHELLLSGRVGNPDSKRAALCPGSA